MTKTRVGVLRGGPSSEYDISLETGKAVLSHLPEQYEAIDLLIDKEGKWHISGVQVERGDVHKHIDVAFNALHGEYGEDGGVQQHLEAVGIPYTGSGIFASAIAMNKGLAKDVYKKHGMLTPHHDIFNAEIHTEKDIHRIFRSLPHPVFVKPLNAGSSVGMSKAQTYDDLVNAISKALEISKRVLVESAVEGKEATCGVIENFRGEKHYALLPIEIIPSEEKAFFDYDAKYDGSTQEICPGRFSKEETKALQEHAIQAHKALGLRHYSRSDFIISPHGIFVLETNTLPGLATESLLPKALDAVGCTLGEFLDHVITQAHTQ